MYTPGTTSGQLQRLTLKDYPAGHDFHPLGLDIYPSYNGNASNLFVVNHARERTVIEHFVLEPSEPTQATWVRTLVSNYFISPNSIALTSPTSFYVSNDHLLTRRIPTFLSHILPVAETFLALPLSWVSHVSLEEDADQHNMPKIRHTFAAMGISFANGVAVSPDGSKVAIAATSIGEIYFYSRSPNNTLSHTHTVPMPFNPDNVMFDDEGSLIVAGHPVSILVLAIKNAF
jgi:DNA-binding beta-propeller fold protein YncE